MSSLVMVGLTIGLPLPTFGDFNAHGRGWQKRKSALFDDACENAKRVGFDHTFNGRRF